MDGQEGYQVNFSVHGDDAAMAGLKDLLNGVRKYMRDNSLMFSERMVVAVTTDREDVAKVLREMAKPAVVGAAASQPDDGQAASEEKPPKAPRKKPGPKPGAKRGPYHKQAPAADSTDEDHPTEW